MHAAPTSKAVFVPFASSPRYVIVSGPPLYVGPGRPLGFHVVDGGASLIACDSLKGLIRINLNTGEVRVLSNRVTDANSKDGARDARAEINYANDLDIVADDNGVQAVCVQPLACCWLCAVRDYNDQRGYFYRETLDIVVALYNTSIKKEIFRLFISCCMDSLEVAFTDHNHYSTSHNPTLPLHGSLSPCRTFYLSNADCCCMTTMLTKYCYS